MTSGPPHTLSAACLLSTAVKVSFRRIPASGTAPRPPRNGRPGNGCQGGPHEYVRPARSTGPLFPVTIRRFGMACAYAESSVGFPGVP